MIHCYYAHQLIGCMHPEVCTSKAGRREDWCTLMHADEASVQKSLSELVGGDKTLMQGCFLVDQLVFTEMMYA